MTDPSALFIDLGAQKRPTVISTVGIEGKTNLFLWLVGLLQASGRHVLITTTAHMFVPTSHWLMVSCRDPTMLPHAFLISPISFCFHCWKANQGKVQGFTPKAIDVLVQRPECDVILTEVDGSRGMSLKVPDEHEPCIPRSSCCMIAVMGGRILGAKVSTENAHRRSQFTDVTGLIPDTPLQPSDLAALVRHLQGTPENAPQSCRRIWLINRSSQCENVTVQNKLL